MSECEIINGNYYFYLRATGKWHLYVQLDGIMYKLVENISTLQQIKEIAKKFAKIMEENK